MGAVAVEAAVEARAADRVAVMAFASYARRAIAAAVVSCGVVLAGRAAAAPTASDLQAARELFAQAEKDEDAGRWQDALEALRRVAQVKLTAGVRYHIALCEEHLGQLVGALADYEVAQTQARAEHAQDVLRLVGKQVATLNSRVPSLTIHVVPELPDERVWLDGQPLAHTMVGVAMPVDPGVHRIEATAPQRPTSTATITLHERDATVLDVKLGEPRTEPPPAETMATTSPPSTPPGGAPTIAAPVATSRPLVPTATDSTPSTAQSAPLHAPRSGAIIATAAAVVLAGGGVAAYLLADDAVASGQRDCLATSFGPCDGEKNTVRAWDWVAAGAWVGAATAATIAILLWTKPSHHSTLPASARLLVGPASLGVGGRF